MKQKLFRFMTAMLTFVIMVSTLSAKKVWMLGDSTMCEYDDSEPTGGRGWGMYFGQFLINEWTSVNRAHGGYDSRGGYEGLWAGCKDEVESGDYVIIQFAHNDAATGGMDYLELVKYYTDNNDEQGLKDTKAIGRGTHPTTTYREMLTKICDEAKAKGATPILVSSVCRCRLYNGKVDRGGRHDIGGSYDGIVDGKLVKGLKTKDENDHSYDYPYQMKHVADSLGVHFIDMTTATLDLYEKYEAEGEGNCFNVLFDKKLETNNDGTHYNVTGALTAARLCAQLMQEQGILGDSIYVPSDMSFNPTYADMGEVYVGQAATKEISLSALGLNPAEGNVNITTSDGILLSYDKENWNTSLSADYSMGSLIKTFYAKVAVSATGAFSGTITATLNDKKVELPITLTGIELGGGEPFAATWALSSNQKATVDDSVSITLSDARLSNLEVKGYDKENGLQIAQVGSTGAWNAALIDRNSTEYVEFAVNAPEGHSIDINRIAMKLKALGGGSLQCHIYYSTDNFVSESQYYNNTGALSDTWKQLDKSVNIKLTEGQSLKIRVYPWSGVVDASRWFCISDVVIGGQSKDDSGVTIDGAISYTLDKGGLNQGDDAVMTPTTLAAGIAAKKWSAGSNISVEGTTNYEGAEGEEKIVQTRIVAPAGTTKDINDANSLTLTLMPDYGYSFVPTKLTFEAARYGTDGGKVGLTVAAGESEEVLLAGADVNRSSRSLTITKFDNKVTSSITATADDPLKIKFSFLEMGSDRTMGISNVVVEGTLFGVPDTSVKYLLTTNVVPADGGSISRDPERDMYMENSQVTLAANANMGYKFKEWQDANGNAIGTEAATTITMNAAKAIRAMFEQTFVGVTLPSDSDAVDLSLATLSNGVIKTVDGTSQFDSFKNPGSATINLNNTKADAVYAISLDAATANAGNTLRLVVTDKATGSVEMDKTIEVEKTGWQDFRTYSVTTDKMTVGEKTLVISFLSGTTYTSNVKNLTFTLSDDTTPSHSLTTVSSPAEGGFVKPANGSYKEGTEIAVTATANAYYSFLKWEDNSTAAERTITMPAEDKTLTAYFQAEPLVIPSTDTNPFKIDWASCVNGEWKSPNLDSFKNGGTATYTITNKGDYSYLIKYNAATANDGVQIKMQLLQDDKEVFSQTQDITNSGGWQTYNSYEMATNDLTQGEYTFVVTFLSSGGYTANVKDIQFKANKPIKAGQMTSLTVDSIAMGESVLDALVGKGHTAIIKNTLTTLPTIIATFDGVDAPVVMSNVEPTIKDSSLTYVKTIADSVYTINFTSYHPYTKGANDETIEVKYSSNGKQTDGNWSNGLYTLTNCGDGWDNSGFKMNQGAYTWNVPSDVKVKQFILKDFSSNYGPGELTACTSGNAKVYVPFKHYYKKSDIEKYDLIINIDDHTAGTPITFNLTGGGQPSAWFEFTIEHVNTNTAPVLKKSDVAVVNNHAVVTLSFDRELKDATVVFDGQDVTAKGGSASLSFALWDHTWDKDYTLTVPVDALKDLFGNKNDKAISIPFSVGAKPATSAQKYDYVVTTATELSEAVTAVNASNITADATRKYIFVKNGDYDLGTSTGSYQHMLKIDAYNVSIIGESQKGVMIHGINDGISSSILDLGSKDGVSVENLTVMNAKNYGLEDKRGVAVAVSGGNHATLYRVTMLSNQDTYVTGDRTYLLECDIHGTVDFICGGGDIFFDKCNLVLEDRGGDVIVAPNTNSATKWGYVFHDCTVKAMEGAASVIDKSWYLGRPWQNEPRAYYINTNMEVLPADNGWDQMSHVTTHFYEYGSTHNGEAIKLDLRGNSPSSTNIYTPVLSTEAAAEYTMRNVLVGTDSWNPVEQITTLLNENNTYSPEEKALTSVALTRQLKANVWNSLCLPFAMEADEISTVFGTGAKVATLSDETSDSTAAFVTASAINANEPCMIYVDKANDVPVIINNATLEAGTATVTKGDITFTGNYTADAAMAEGTFLMSDKNIKKVSGTAVTLDAFSAFFTTSPAANIITYTIDGTSTGITNVQKDGQNRSDVIYNIAGQRVSKTQKGIYIMNGKKVIIKR